MTGKAQLWSSLSRWSNCCCTGSWGYQFSHVPTHAFVWGDIHVCACMCGGQKTALECLSFLRHLLLLFETGSHVSLGLHQVGSSDWLSGFYQSLLPSCHHGTLTACFMSRLLWEFWGTQTQVLMLVRLALGMEISLCHWLSAGVNSYVHWVLTQMQQLPNWTSLHINSQIIVRIKNQHISFTTAMAVNCDPNCTPDDSDQPLSCGRHCRTF